MEMVAEKKKGHGQNSLDNPHAQHALKNMT